ncbi:hypothetical protein [Chryseobacterium sp. 5_R23647]|nr:hypothetical protein [Chryseobacterium sp. 5_R23647]
MMLYNEKVNCHIELFDKDAEIPTQGRKKNYDVITKFELRRVEL